MRAVCCSTRSSSRPSLSSSRLRVMSASWPMTPKASSRLRNMENSLCRFRVVTRIASGIRAVETRSNRVTSAQEITNFTGEERQAWGTSALSIFMNIKTQIQSLAKAPVWLHKNQKFRVFYWKFVVKTNGGMKNVSKMFEKWNSIKCGLYVLNPLCLINIVLWSPWGLNLWTEKLWLMHYPNFAFREED